MLITRRRKWEMPFTHDHAQACNLALIGDKKQLEISITKLLCIETMTKS